MAIKIPGMEARSVPILAPAKERKSTMANSEDDLVGAYRDGGLSARGKPNQANPAAKSTFNVDDIVVGGGNRNSYKDYNASEDEYNNRVSSRNDDGINGSDSRGAGRGAAGGRSKGPVAPPAAASTIADVCFLTKCIYLST